MLEEIENSEDFMMLPDLTKRCSIIRKELAMYPKTSKEETKEEMDS
jgi:hypothetical protein